MPGSSGQRRWQHGARAQALVLLMAGLWLLILFTCIADPLPISAASAQARSLAPTPTATLPISPIPTNILTPTVTPTGGGKPTATTTVGPTATGAATATATPADTGGDGGGYQGSGPQPTRVVLAQPTAGVGGDSGVQGLSPAAFGSNGLLVATTLSCVIAMLGLIVAVIALSVLIRTGYGPFLRVLLLGNRAGRGSRSEVLPAGAANGGRSGDWANWDDDQEDGRGYRGGGVARRGSPAPIRAPQREAPVSRRRPDWRG